MIIVRCPSCSLKLSFNYVKDYKQRLVTCPRCHFKDIAGKFHLLQEDKPFAYFIKNIETGEEHRLKNGQNTVGRSAINSKADLMFNDPTNHMSRLHATVTINEVSNDNEPEILLTDNNSANGSYIKGMRLDAENSMPLSIGERFQLGQSFFEIVKRHEE